MISQVKLMMVALVVSTMYSSATYAKDSSSKVCTNDLRLCELVTNINDVISEDILANLPEEL